MCLLASYKKHLSLLDCNCPTEQLILRGYLGIVSIQQSAWSAQQCSVRYRYYQFVSWNTVLFVNFVWNHDPGKESEHIVTMAATLIVSETLSMQCDLETYPTISDTHASDTTPPLLLLLLRNTFGSQPKQFITARPRIFIAPLLLGLGVQLDDNYASKFLLQQLSRLGTSASYDEVERYRQSVLEATCPDSGIGHTFPSGMMTPWVANNVYHNFITLDGSGSFHGMGIFRCR